MPSLIGAPPLRTQVLTLECAQARYPGKEIRSSRVPGTRFERVRACDTPDGASAITRTLFLSAHPAVEHEDLSRCLERLGEATFLQCPTVGDVRQRLEHSQYDVIILDHSLGRDVVAEVCPATRLESPVSYLFLLKPRIQNRFSSITDDELDVQATVDQLMRAIKNRLGI
jgi:hypothetical protein